MFFVSKNGIRYRITSRPSIFTDRNNARQQLHDIVLQKQSRGYSEGGGKYEDGNRYITVAVWAQEDLAVIRHYEKLPPEISEARLHQWGLTNMDGTSPDAHNDHGLFTTSVGRDGFWQWCAKPPGNDSVYGGFETEEAAIRDAETVFTPTLRPVPGPGF